MSLSFSFRSFVLQLLEFSPREFIRRSDRLTFTSVQLLTCRFNGIDGFVRSLAGKSTRETA
ncbi:hypothetical protein ACEYW6_29140 [Nostoc sp. UIC 10607]